MPQTQKPKYPVIACALLVLIPLEVFTAFYYRKYGVPSVGGGVRGVPPLWSASLIEFFFAMVSLATFQLLLRRYPNRRESNYLVIGGLILLVAAATLFFPYFDPLVISNGDLTIASVIVSWIYWSIPIILSPSIKPSGDITNEGSGRETAK